MYVYDVGARAIYKSTTYYHQIVNEPKPYHNILEYIFHLICHPLFLSTFPKDVLGEHWSKNFCKQICWLESIHAYLKVT